MPIFCWIKRGFDRYLLRVAAQNKKMFGNGKLDCCKLNKKP